MSFIEVFLLGVGLAVDASCVCTTNGLVYRPNIIKSLEIALPFAIFQGIMPLIGYFGIGLLPDSLFQYNHIIAFLLLGFVGINMLLSGFRSTNSNDECNENPIKSLTFKIMLVQGISTSIDALSVGVTLGNEPLNYVISSVIIIACITFMMCFASVRIGEKLGTKLNNKAEILGGIVLVLIGVRLLIGG